MAVHCPYCRHRIEVKGAKPGRFTAKCPRCTRKFVLAIPDEPGKEPIASGIRSERLLFETVPAPPQSGAASATARGAAETDLWSPPASPPGDDPHATAVIAGSGPPPADDPAATAIHERSRPDPALPRTSPAAADPDATGPAAPSPMRETEDDQTLDLMAASPRRPADPGGRARPSAIGGYQVLKELGQGGMGAVYLARQLSLNRNVALKVMKPEWADDATFVARFTREAYAAAQLTHHNVVQIYDFGEDQGTTYFSMEFVDGVNLGGLVRQKKRLDVEEAAGYVLQAARGLKFAHDQSMIHRDIKPENLLLNRQGIVKVADLGLVKTPEFAEAEAQAEGGTGSATGKPGGTGSASGTPERMTRANVAMGTPAFMAPEQARDAAHVDARADIYSLGCTLYDLVTGRPPFEGRTVMEIMTKHQTEPVTPPEMVVKRVPKALSEIIMKMVAKKPDERFANLGEVIRALENFLGVQGSGAFTPREEHANLLEECVAAFNAAPTARLRAVLLPVGLGACAAFVLLFALVRQPRTAGAFLALGAMTSLAYFVVRGVRQKTPAFLKATELALGGAWTDWLMALAGLVVAAVGLFFVGQLGVWIAMAVVAVLAAVGIELTLDRTARAERREPLRQVEEMLRSMRLQGLEEDALRQFVSKYGGDRWEEFYEALFGYEAKLAARARWGRGDRGQARPRFAPWRDPVFAWLDAKVRSRREAKEKAKLEKIEEKGLCAQGENLVTARRKAKRTAEAMVATASEIRQSAGRRGPRSVAIARAMQEAAARPEKVLVVREKGLYGDRSRGVLERIIGPKPRFLVGLLLAAGSMLWAHQNGLISAEHARGLAEAAREATSQFDAGEVGKNVKNLDFSGAGRAATKGTAKLQAVGKKTVEDARSATNTKTVEISMVPPALAALVSSFGAGAAGLVLIFSAFFGGTRMAVCSIASAAVMMFGPKMGLPTFNGRLDPSLAPVVIGGAILGAGLFFNRDWR